MSRFISCYIRGLVFFPQIARACRDRGRALLFRGWSRLCLHAASLSVAEGASAAATAVARAARAEAMEKNAEEAADARETAAATTGRQLEKKLDEATGATSAALERAEKAEGALRTQRSQLVRTVPITVAMLHHSVRCLRWKSYFRRTNHLPWFTGWGS